MEMKKDFRFSPISKSVGFQNDDEWFLLVFGLQ